MSDGQMVMIGCKAPNGLILNLDRYEKLRKDTNDVRRVFGKQTVTLKGWAHEHNKPDLTAESGGYRLTAVPADFWQEWLKVNADSPLLADGIILAPPSIGPDRHGTAVAQAREHSAVPKMHAPLSAGDPRAGPVKTYTQKDDA